MNKMSGMFRVGNVGHALNGPQANQWLHWAGRHQQFILGFCVLNELKSQRHPRPGMGTTSFSVVTVRSFLFMKMASFEKIKMSGTRKCLLYEVHLKFYSIFLLVSSFR